VKAQAIAALAALMLPLSASAEVTSVAKNGFEVKETSYIAAKPDSVFYMLMRPARWWSSQHTFSGDAANLSATPKAGACWCEKLPDGGSVQHLQVVYVKPNQVLLLRGALGPLQSEPVIGVMTWELTASGKGTVLTTVYAVGGYSTTSFATWSKAVDGVLAEQSERLKRTVETGKPDAHAQH
jgi:uncharacterized protein YndB with AHSA1/START domain